MPYKPVVLIVLDGVGVNTTDTETPFTSANIPTFHELEKFWPFTTLRASGVAVGLPWGEEGNSEVGHLTMGSGRVVYHHLPRIITAIHDGTFFDNPAFKKAADHVKEHGSTLHLMGLFSTGSVHAYIDHLYALIEFAGKEGISAVKIHAFTDGKDAPPDEAALFFERFEERRSKLYEYAEVVSIMGRVYAMDRDENWDRTEKAYNLLTKGEGAGFTDPSAYMREGYKKEIFDEFAEPAYRIGGDGQPAGRIASGDAVIFFNFREDSTRQLTSAFLEPEFAYFSREKLEDLLFVTMTEYDKRFSAEVAFPPIDIEWPLAQVISSTGKKQLHVAETEKYAHITYFFNGGKERPFEGEERVLIPSPPSSHFNEHPEMSAEKVADAVIQAIPKYDFILANFANGDMVGHTGDFEATIKAIEVIDFSLGKIIPRVLEAGGAVIITGDHGNSEEKRYRATGEPRTKHTTNPVPFFIVAADLRSPEPKTDQQIRKQYEEVGGVLTDVAPSILDLMGLQKPAEMMGIDLVSRLKGGKH